MITKQISLLQHFWSKKLMLKFEDSITIKLHILSFQIEYHRHVFLFKLEIFPPSLTTHKSVFVSYTVEKQKPFITAYIS